MAILTTQRGVNQPLMFRDIIAQSIATTDVDPIATTEASRTSRQKSMIDHGFCIRGNASGNVTIYGITWHSYNENGKFLTITAGGKADLAPIALYTVGNTWELVPLIKVYANNDNSYASGCTAVNIGIL